MSSLFDKMKEREVGVSSAETSGLSSIIKDIETTPYPRNSYNDNSDSDDKRMDAMLLFCPFKVTSNKEGVRCCVEDCMAWNKKTLSCRMIPKD